MSFYISNNVKSAIETIESFGGEAYLVGGCVRDMFLGLSPHDYDIATSLLPDDIIKLFDKAIPTGISHGTVTVIIGGESIEITTYRTDGKYSDNRHPEKVNFVKNIEKDLSRRDFTVNAIAYNPSTGIKDPYDGIKDINNKILRTVGDARKRFNEDSLRIMRLFRFAAQLGFDIEKNALSAALEMRKKLENISRERIASELFKTLSSNNFEKAFPIFSTDAYSFIHLNPLSKKICLNNLPKERNIRFYKLIEATHSCYNQVCTELKTDKALLRYCKEVSEISNKLPKDTVECKYLLNKYDIKSIEDALTLNVLDKTLLFNTLKSNEPYKINELSINGDILKDLGFSGKEIGEILDILISEVIKDPTLNNTESLICIAKKCNIKHLIP